MPLGLGIAVSHAPGLYQDTEEGWDRMWHRLSVDRGIPQPASVYRETGDHLQEMIRRIKVGHATLRQQFEDYDPEILIIIGGDQVEEFDRSNVPQILIYLGEHAKGPRPGYLPAAPGAAPVEVPQVEFDTDVEFSQALLHKLVRREGFDVAFSTELRNLPGRRQGVPHAFTNPSAVLFQNKRPKTVLVFENTYDPPSLSARRCYELGAAIARIVKDDPRRIAILGSGGLAHDPGGKRSGWLDVPLDHWFLRQIGEGNGRATEAMFSFDSDTMVAGTGEIRAWITVAGAMEEMGSRATVVDYVEGAKSVTGLGFAYWSTQEVAAAVR